MIGPDGRPPVFDGAAWISADGRYWWNGEGWLRIKRRAFRPPIAVALLVIAVLAIAAFVLLKIPQPSPPPYGVSNMKIDSNTQFEFDYRRSTACKDLTFEYVFFDQSGQQVDRYADEKHNAVLGDVTNHFTIYSFTPLDPRGSGSTPHRPATPEQDARSRNQIVPAIVASGVTGLPGSYPHPTSGERLRRWLRWGWDGTWSNHAARRDTNETVAGAAVVLGIAGFVLICFPLLGMLVSIVATALAVYVVHRNLDDGLTVTVLSVNAFTLSLAFAALAWSFSMGLFGLALAPAPP